MSQIIIEFKNAKELAKKIAEYNALMNPVTEPVSVEPKPKNEIKNADLPVEKPKTEEATVTVEEVAAADPTPTELDVNPAPVEEVPAVEDVQEEKPEEVEAVEVVEPKALTRDEMLAAVKAWATRDKATATAKIVAYKGITGKKLSDCTDEQIKAFYDANKADIEQ